MVVHLLDVSKARTIIDYAIKMHLLPVSLHGVAQKKFVARRPARLPTINEDITPRGTDGTNCPADGGAHPHRATEGIAHYAYHFAPQVTTLPIAVSVLPSAGTCRFEATLITIQPSHCLFQ